MATLCEYYHNERLALQGGIGSNRAANAHQVVARKKGGLKMFGM
jgi:hypothetical protein